MFIYFCVIEDSQSPPPSWLLVLLHPDSECRLLFILKSKHVSLSAVLWLDHEVQHMSSEDVPTLTLSTVWLMERGIRVIWLKTMKLSLSSELKPLNRTEGNNTSRRRRENNCNISPSSKWCHLPGSFFSTFSNILTFWCQPTAELKLLLTVTMLTRSYLLANLEACSFICLIFI